jgi:putative Mn2+ efflux pump MntP
MIPGFFMNSFFTIFLIAVGLAMDAFAVAVSCGFMIRQLHLRYAMRVAVFFGFFQAFMPVLGWISGFTIREYIQAFDHWIAFGLLAFIGGKMIYESFVISEVDACKTCPYADAGSCPDFQERIKKQFSVRTLLFLAVATSIDALAVGVSISILGDPIIFPAIVIGLVTFVMSLGGVIIGNKVGHLFESKIEIAGGIILIGIGLKILLQGLFF